MRGPWMVLILSLMPVPALCWSYLGHQMIGEVERMPISLLRACRGGLGHAGIFHLSAAHRQGFARIVSLREQLILRDLGTWAHFVEDASQPMHVSLHYNGWAPDPNPDGFVTGPGLHAKFESAFVNANVQEADIEALVEPFHHCDDTVQACTEQYLTATARWTTRLYQLEKAGRVRQSDGGIQGICGRQAGGGHQQAAQHGGGFLARVCPGAARTPKQPPGSRS